MSGKKIHLDNGHFYICLYCSNFVLGETKNSKEYGLYGCEKRKNGKGKYIQLSNILQEGSEDFIPSGLPTHPHVLKELVRINPKCSSIPSDVNATESGWDFMDKVKKYMQPENIKSARDF